MVLALPLEARTAEHEHLTFVAWRQPMRFARYHVVGIVWLQEFGERAQVHHLVGLREEGSESHLGIRGKEYYFIYFEI
jgi:hypothetical protein